MQNILAIIKAILQSKQNLNFVVPDNFVFRPVLTAAFLHFCIFVVLRKSKFNSPLRFCSMFETSLIGA